MYPDFSGNRGASDAPEKFSLFDEEKPRLMSVNFFEHRPSLAPPSFLQPGEKSVSGDLYGGAIYMGFLAVWVQMSENTSKKEITNFTAHFLFLGEQ